MKKSTKFLAGMSLALTLALGGTLTYAGVTGMFSPEISQSEEATDQTQIIEELRGQLAAKDEELAQKTQKISELEESKNAVDQQLSELQTEKDSLFTQLQTANSDKDQLTQRISQIESEIETLTQEKNKLEQEKASLESQISNLQQEKTTLTQQLSQLQSEKEKADQQISDLEKQIEDLQADAGDEFDLSELGLTSKDSVYPLKVPNGYLVTFWNSAPVYYVSKNGMEEVWPEYVSYANFTKTKSGVLITGSGLNSILFFDFDTEKATKVYDGNNVWSPNFNNDKCAFLKNSDGIVYFDDSTKTCETVNLDAMSNLGKCNFLEDVGNNNYLLDSEKGLCIYNTVTKENKEIFSEETSFNVVKKAGENLLISTDDSDKPGVLFFNSSTLSAKKIYEEGYNYEHCCPLSNGYLLMSNWSSTLIYVDSDTQSVTKIDTSGQDLSVLRPTLNGCCIVNNYGTVYFIDEELTLKKLTGSSDISTDTIFWDTDYGFLSMRAMGKKIYSVDVKKLEVTQVFDFYIDGGQLYLMNFTEDGFQVFINDMIKFYKVDKSTGEITLKSFAPAA